MHNNILFVGHFFPRQLLKTVQDDSKGRMGMSNHNFEMSIIKGLSKQEINLSCLSIPGVYSFPNNNTRFFIKSESYNENNINVTSISFCNLFIINKVWMIVAAVIAILRELNKFTGKDVDIIVNPPSFVLLFSCVIARVFSRKKTYFNIIVPDLPFIITKMDRRTGIKGAILKLLNSLTMNMIRSSDSLVVLTKEMMDVIERPKNFIVMEGLFDVETINKQQANKLSLYNGKEIILYSGTLRRIFGVLNLLKAFSLLKNSEVELWICGEGDAENDIRDAALFDSRIKFYGLVDSATALELQSKATILVNPRTSEGEYTKYSFPSKTIEYLYAGKSVVINRLPGIPEDYYEYVYLPKDESVEALADVLNSIINSNFSDRINKAYNGRNFIIHNKNSIYQTLRILNLINSTKESSIK